MHSPQSAWFRKFVCAFRGIIVSIREQNSFYVHFPVALSVVFAAWRLGLSRAEWCLLVLCIAGVVTCELFNSAIEHLAKAITREENPHLRDALDAASGAVLVAAMATAGVGLLIFFGTFRG